MKKLIAFLSTFLSLTVIAAVPPTVQEKQYTTPNNALINPGFENGTAKWAAYSDTAGTSPTDCTGGSPVAGLLSTTTVSLAGNLSGTLVKDAANRQGQGISNTFAIDRSDQAKMLGVEFDYKVASGTFVAGSDSASSDVTVWIYDVTNAQIIPVTPYKLMSNTQATFKGVFQTASNSTSYRVCAHIGSTSASAYTLAFDNFKVSPQVPVYGAPLTDPVAYTPTLTGFGTPTNVNFYSWREGAFLVGYGYFTSGTPTHVAAQITIGYNGTNANVTSDGAKITVGQVLGISTVGASSTTNFGYCSVAPSGSQNFFYLSQQSSTQNCTSSQFADYMASNGTNVTITYRVPITGWSSNVLMSNDADTRVVAARYSGTSISYSAGNQINFSTLDYDTHSAVTTGASWKFSAPVSGKYSVSLSLINTSATAAISSQPTIYIYKNGSLAQAVASMVIQTASSIPTALIGSGEINLVSGDYIDVRLSGIASYTTSASASDNWIAIKRISGPSAIAASETVAARYKTAVSQALAGSNIIINFDSKDWDSHNAVTTGASWKFTAPISGIYSIESFVAANSQVAATTDPMDLNVYKNGAFDHSLMTIYGNGATINQRVAGAGKIKLVAGDYIDIRVTLTRALSTLAGDNRYVWVAITRIGN